LGVYTQTEGENLLDNYADWLNSIKYAIYFDKNHFREPKPKKGKIKKPIANGEE
jgi:hypothetical protein